MMLQAQLRGKLTRREEDLEDLLTSNVFGSIKYIPYEDGLLPLLYSCINDNGDAPIHALQPISLVDYEFWPWLQEANCEGCEPDVLITIQFINGQKMLILVEAKYLSDKSSEANEAEAPKDQLAREWDNLTSLAHRKKATQILLYVTADIGYPKKSIKDSCQEYMQKRKKDMRVFWISWRKLPNLFANKREDILSDLVEVLKRQGLTFFQGIPKLDLIDIKWSFWVIANWNWSSYRKYSIYWAYQVIKTYNWQYKIEPIEWRFAE
jgi:hypothetical protein